MAAPSNLHAIIRERQSIVGFSVEPVPPQSLRAILEAAQWAPSSRNAQPWRFLVGVRGEGDGHEKLSSCLTGLNRTWAPRAHVLILAVAETVAPGSDRENRYAEHDTGLAVANILLQAVSQGLAAHPMAGFDKQSAIELFGIPEGFLPMTMIAVGHNGTGDGLNDRLRSRDGARRPRRPLSESAFGGVWGVSFCDAD